jgi:hypothetical protein
MEIQKSLQNWSPYHAELKTTIEIEGDIIERRVIYDGSANALTIFHNNRTIEALKGETALNRFKEIVCQIK